MVEGEGQDEEGAVAGHVHLEGHVPLVQTHRLPLLGQGRLEQLPAHLGPDSQYEGESPHPDSQYEGESPHPDSQYEGESPHSYTAQQI